MTDRRRWSRRRVIVVGAAASAVAALGGVGYVNRFGIRLYLAFQPNPKSPLMPSATGTLAEEAKRTLWAVASAIGDRWEMHELPEKELARLVDLKTQREPSYLATYQAATALWEAAGPEPLERLLTASRRGGDEFTAEAKIQDWVLREFVQLHLIYGGYKQFGFRNYRGAFGGQFGYRKAAAE